jgi:hypothetical protein
MSFPKEPANAISISYTLVAATISSAANLLSIMGPPGKSGILRSMSVVLTTATTDATTELRVGDAGDADQFGVLSVPIASIGAGQNDLTVYGGRENIMPKDTAVIIATDGGCTAGAADIVVVIDWFD